MSLTKNEVLKRFKKIHSDKYDYSKFVYTNSLEKSIIICKTHSEFLQRPNDHVKGQGCPECGKLKRKNSLLDTLSVFIKKAKKVHNKKYDYSKAIYIKSSIKLEIVCNKHGSFWKTPNKHLLGQGCPKCNNCHRRSQKDFINDAVSIHGNLYDYSKSQYKSCDKKLVIKCFVHGEFLQTPYSHINKATGCPSCAKYGFKYHDSAIMYYIKIEYKDITVFKIGVTNKTVEDRFLLSDLNKIEVILTKKFDTGYNAFYAEQEILKNNKKFLYKGKPLLNSNGNTELFKEDVLFLIESYFV